MMRRALFAPLPGRRAAFAFACALAAVCALGAGAWPASARAQEPPAPASPSPSYRIFLNDGTPLVSAGELVRSGGRVVFSMPIGDTADPALLQVVSLPEHVIDWPRTNRYADAVRFRRYAASQGEAEYQALSNAVARALSDMAFAPDPEAKLRIGEAMRRHLMAWPADHFGYRSADVRDMAAIIEESLTDVRAGSGEQAFDLQLVATIEPPAEELLPEPPIEESVRLAWLASRVADTPSERVSLQSAILVALAQPSATAPEPWMRVAVRQTKASLAFEARLDREYGEVAKRARSEAAASAKTGDVQAIESLLGEVRRRDERLGRHRPDSIAALIDELSIALDVARRNRLALDQWRYRQDRFGAYKRAAEAALSRIGKHAADFDAVRNLSGPDTRRLADIERALTELEVSMLPVAPPLDLRAAHDTLLASIRLLRDAARLRRDAMAGGDIDLAHNASSAAAGGWLLLNSVRGTVADYFRRPSPL